MTPEALAAPTDFNIDTIMRLVCLDPAGGGSGGLARGHHAGNAVT